MKKGIITSWKKNEGDFVTNGEPVIIVETEKTTVEVESAFSGRLGKIIAPEGSERGVGELLAIILEEGESMPADLSEVVRTDLSILSSDLGEPSSTAVMSSVGVKATSETKRKVPISPLARKLADELGLDVGKIGGTGPGGRITAKDVRIFLSSQSVEPQEPRVAKRIKLTPVRRTILQRLVESARSSAHVTLFSEMDVTKLLEEYKIIESHESEVRITYTDIFVKLIGSLLRKHMLLNSSLENDEITIFEDINIGVATAIEDGLVVPVIRNADTKSIFGIANIKNELVTRAREGRLSPTDVVGGTFTISNLGTSQVDGFTPIVNPPQCAILGIGRISDKPVVKDRQIVIRSLVTVSLTFDHRIVDGAYAAKFVDSLSDLLQDPKSAL